MSPESNNKTLINSATLVMGLSGAGKSSLLATLMEYVWETSGLITLYYSSDGGGFPTQIQSLIRQGICRLWRMRTRSGQGLAFETCQRASEGYWPERIKPLTGEVDPMVRLVPPTTLQLVMSCPNGHVVKTVPVQALLTPDVCPTCKLPVSLQTNARVEQTITRTRGFEKVGACCFDGLSSMCSWMMDDLSKRDLGGEKSRLGGVVQSGDLVFGENNRAQVGFTQNRAEQLALNSLSIPNLVVPPVWTALAQEGSDEGSLMVVGPSLPGQAKTAVAPQWFGNCLEAVVVETKDNKKYRRINLSEYIDATNRRHLCKVRTYPGLMPPFLEDEDRGDDSPKFVNFNLGTFYRLLDVALAKTDEIYAARFANAPGLPDEEMTYGTPAATPLTLPAQPVGPPGPRPIGPPGFQGAPGPASPGPVGPAPAGPGGPRVGPPGFAGVTGPVVPTGPAGGPQSGGAGPVLAPGPAPRGDQPTDPGGDRPGPADPAPAPAVTTGEAVQAAGPATPGPKAPARGPVPPPAGRRPKA